MSGTTLRFMLQYPETNGPEGDMLAAGPVAELASAAEAAGWSGFAFTEHPVPGARWLDAGGHQTLDPFVALGHVAAATARLRLLTYLAVAPYRNPFLLAKAAATVDVLSNGRFILGIGTGYLKGEFRALGVDFEERNALFDEALDVLPQFWHGETFSFRGRHFVAQRAQGWMPLTGPVDISSTTRTPRIASWDELAVRIRELQRNASSGASLDVAVAYTDPTIADPDGDTGRHRNALAALAAIGVTWVVVPGPSRPHPAAREFVERFASTYIAR